MVVVKLGGGLLDDAKACAALWAQIADAQEPIVVVHGGGASVDELLRALGRPIEKINGLRVTPEADIDLVAGVLAGTLNTRIVAQLHLAGVHAVGLSLGDGPGGTIVERVADKRLGCVGEVTGGDGKLITLLLGEGYVPVVSSIGIDSGGQLLNVNADAAALGVAGAIGAESVLFLSDVPGILDAGGEVIGSLDADKVEELICSGVISGGMASKARSAVAAVERFGVAAMIASWNEPLDLHGGGTGTTLRPTERGRLRPTPTSF